MPGGQYHHDVQRTLHRRFGEMLPHWLGTLPEAGWQGTAPELTDVLDRFCDTSTRRFTHYVPGPNAVGSWLRRHEPVIQAAGWRLVLRRTKKVRLIEFVKVSP
jgi:hypothetical protein